MNADMFDLVVYGSTSGAVATSIQAARLGRSVALVTPHRHIGWAILHCHYFDLGMLSNSLL